MFVPGQIYRRRALHEMYRGQQQGGISTPAKQPFIFLFTGQSGEPYGYKDGWQDNGVFYYTGEGQQGDMRLPGHDKAAAARAPMPGPAELKSDIEALETWVKGIRDRRK